MSESEGSLSSLLVYIRIKKTHPASVSEEGRERRSLLNIYKKTHPASGRLLFRVAEAPRGEEGAWCATSVSPSL